jgi:hypothetical protein
MEGGYEDLPDVRLPLLVALRENDRARYALLFAVDDTRATIGDPITGEVSRWSRERFSALWTGSVVQLTPVEEERKAVAARLAQLRDPVRRALRGVGWGPPYPPRVGLLIAWVAVAGVAALGPHAGSLAAVWTWLVAASCAGSLWSWLASDHCALCSYARQLAGGVPLAAMGAVLYAGLLASAFVSVPPLVTSVAIGAAVGAHAALVRELAKAKVACGACLFVAACATAAAAVAIAQGAPLVGLVAGAAAACVSVVIVLPAARAREKHIWRATAESLAKATFAESRSEGGVRVVAFTRAGCTACAFFHAAVKPALVATFGDAIVLDERPLGRERTVAPIVVVHGGRRALFIGMPGEDPCGVVIGAVQRALDAGGDGAGTMAVHDAGGT